MSIYLDFEEPIKAIEEQIEKTKESLTATLNERKKNIPAKFRSESDIQKEIKETFVKGRWKHLDDIHYCGNVDEPVIFKLVCMLAIEVFN